MRGIALAFALSFGAAAFASQGSPVVPIDSLVCYSLEAETHTPIVTATRYGGGILFATSGGRHLTTERCLVNLGPVQSPQPSTLRAPLHCNDAEGELVYYAVATRVALTQGVWKWTEEGTNDVYLSTLECTATGLE